MNSADQFPLFFIHSGYSEYMEYSLRQARSVLPRNVEILLLGDSTNDRFDFVTHVDMAQYSDGGLFRGCYRHHSVNQRDYEMFCLERWILLYRCMVDRNIDRCIVVDTDVMIYDVSVQVLEDFEKNYDCGGLHFGNDSFSIGSCIWKRTTLKRFCEFIMTFYGSEELFRKAAALHENISDMVVFEFFIKEFPEIRFFNLMELRNGSCVDNGIGESRTAGPDFDYQMTGGIFPRKKIIWHGNMPFGYYGSEGRPVAFHQLHFQGMWKWCMSWAYRGKEFAGRRRLDWKFWLKCKWIFFRTFEYCLRRRLMKKLTGRRGS